MKLINESEKCDTGCTKHEKHENMEMSQLKNFENMKS